MRISDFSIKRPVFTIVTMLIILLLGAVSFLKIPVTLIPDLNPPIGVVVTSYNGASPQEVNEKVTKPLEANLSTLPGIKSVQSTSQEGSNFILLQFNWSTNIDDVESDILQRIDQTPIPDDAQKPRFLKFDPAQFPIIQLSLRATDDQTDIRKLAEDLEQELRRAEGVANVNVSGKLIEEIRVTLDQKKLMTYHLTQQDVVQAIRANEVSMPGEPIETEGKEQLTTRILSTFHSVDELNDMPLLQNPQTKKMIRLKDVGKVEIAEQASETETRANEKQAVLMSVLQGSDANTAEVSSSFKASLDRLLDQDTYKNVEADILFDQGDYVKLAISNIGQSLLYGGIFAMLVLFVFLRGIKSPIIIGVAIPYSVIVTFVLMYFADFALNIMTLGALALGIGMLVDNAIVVIENIERHLGLGKPPKEAASIGTKEVAGAITASTLTTVAVFIPVLFISGLIGQIFTEFALTIAFSLLASLAVAVTVIPMLAARILTKPKGDLEARRRRSKAYNNYRRSIEWALRYRIVVIFITTIFMAAAAFGLMKVGTEFLPATDEGFVSIAVELPNGASRNATDDAVKKIEDVLKQQDDVEVYVSLIGGTQQGLSQGISRINEAEMYVKMKPLDNRERSVFEFVDDVEPLVKKQVDKDVSINFNLQTAAGSTPNTLTFTVADSDTDRLSKTVTDLQHELEKVDGIRNVTNDTAETKKEIQIAIDREKARTLGVIPAQLAQTVNEITRGTLATQITTDDQNIYSVFVQLDEAYRNKIDELKKLQIRTGNGAFIPLSNVATFEIKDGPVSIERVDQTTAVGFTVTYASNLSLGEISNKVDDVIEELSLPEETEITFSGDRELFDNSIQDMIMAVALSILLVYFVMAAQFESFKYPFVIMFTVPLMLIGVTLGLFITETPISVTAIIGILVLVGIVVNNGIVLVDTINQRKRAEMETYEAIVTSSVDRIRPILMTALTTILGLLPLALGIGEGTEINQPMGITVIGGLISSTFLTLYIVPVVYSLFDKETRKRARKKG